MPTVVITFPFAADAQSFASTPGTSVVMAWDGANGNPAGCLSSRRAVKGNTGADNTWTRTITWEAMGVPANTTITGVTAASIQSRCTEYTAGPATGNTSGTVTLADGATTITLSAQRGFTAVDSAWTATAGIDVSGLSLPSTDNATITIRNHLQNSNSSSSAITLKQDQLTFTVTYTINTTQVTVDSAAPSGNHTEGVVRGDYIDKMIWN